MLIFSNAKINIGLNITEKRNDGFHNIETIFYPIPLHDIIEFVVNKESNKLEFSNSGIKVDADNKHNLIVKAYELLKKDYDLPPLKIHLHKKIPMGAGLGGGSSNASFILSGLNKYFCLDIKDNELENYASKLGSDCAFFIKNKPVFAQETGNIFKPVSIDLKGYYLVLIKPEIHSSTQEAYGGVKPHFPEKRLMQSIINKPDLWKDNVINDFEKNIFKLYPEIKALKENLYKTGAIYASMSGSGSSVFGIFKENPKPLKLFNNYFSFVTLLN